MFRFFKKKKELTTLSSSDIEFFFSIANKLPEEYNYIKNQINKDFLLFFEPNQLKIKNWFNFSLNSSLEKKYLNSKKREYFQIRDIKLFNKDLNCYQNFNFSISDGLLIGFYIEDVDFKKYDLYKTDVSNIYEKFFVNKDLQNLLKYFENDFEKKIIERHFKNTYEICLENNNVLYFFKDLGDGDVLAIDKKGDCYKLNHDPFKIEKILNYNDFKKQLEIEKF